MSQFELQKKSTLYRGDVKWQGLGGPFTEKHTPDPSKFHFIYTTWCKWHTSNFLLPKWHNSDVGHGRERESEKKKKPITQHTGYLQIRTGPPPNVGKNRLCIRYLSMWLQHKRAAQIYISSQAGLSSSKNAKASAVIAVGSQWSDAKVTLIYKNGRKSIKKYVWF